MRLGLAMLAPALIVLVGVLVYPIGIAIESSFFSINAVTRAERFVGLGNYRELLVDPEFWETMGRTVVWVVGAMSTQAAFGIGLALLLNRQVKGRALVRGAVLFPFLVPAIIAVLAWRWIFSDSIGIANYLLVDVLGILESPISWFSPSWALVSVVIMSLWKYMPFWALFILARLQTLPVELSEAATIDGANTWQRFRYITWPWIFPVLMVLMILRTIWAFNEFDMTYLPAQGGPLGATTTMPVYIRRVAFDLGDVGASAAVTMALLVIVATLVGVYFRIYRWSENRLNG